MERVVEKILIGLPLCYAVHERLRHEVMPSMPISSPAVVGEADAGKIKSIEPEITPVTGAFYFKSSPDPSLNKAALDKFRQDHPNLNITFGPTVNGQTLLLTSPVK